MTSAAASSTQPRVCASDIIAAVESADRSGWPDYRSASVATGHVLLLTIRDAHTGRPVPDAWVRGVDVAESKKDGSPPDFEIGDNAFDMPNHDTPYGVPFKESDQADLDKARADIASLEDESLTLLEEHASITNRIALSPPPPPPMRIAPELQDRLSEIEARFVEIGREIRSLEADIHKILDKRETRRAWVHAIKALLAVAGRWDDPIDHTEPEGWTSKASAAFKKVTRRPLWGGSSPKRAVDRLWSAVGRVYKTDRNGVVTIPLPAEASGYVRVEMRHLKLLDPDDATGFDPSVSPACRAEWTGGRDTAGDDPTADPRPEESKWHLVQECPDRVEAPFRNYLVLPFDTAGRLCSDPITAETLALVWAQCAWMEAGEKDYILEPDDSAIWDGRGLKDQHPTFFVPTRGSGSGRRYGEFGNARTIGADTSAFPGLIDAHVTKAGATWFSWVDAWTIAGEYKSKADADAAHSALAEPHKAGHRVATVESAKGERSDLSLAPDTTHVLIRTRDHTAHGASKERAEAAALNTVYLENLSNADRAAGKAKRTVTRVDIPGRQGDAGIAWRIVYQTTRSGQGVAYQSKLFDDPKAALSTLFNNRIHYGVDVAGAVGDPIFAPVGGTTKVGGSATDHGGGLKVGITPWIRDDVTYISMCHNKENIAEKGTLVKAGDAVAIMGRTGNHRPWKQGNSWRGDLGAPTHTHFAAYSKGRLADFTSAIVSRHGFQLPRNAMPHLLPCAAEYEDKAKKTTPDASDPRKCKVRHGSGAFDPSAPNKGWLCWAYAKGSCPFKES